MVGGTCDGSAYVEDTEAETTVVSDNSTDSEDSASSLPAGLTQEAVAMFCEQNRLREDPKAFIPYVEARIA